jgi:hypothetical protein
MHTAQHTRDTGTQDTGHPASEQGAPGKGAPQMGAPEKGWSSMVMSRSRRPRRADPPSTEFVTPTVAEAERLLEEARRAEAERAQEMARQSEDEKRRRADFDREAASLVTAIEARVQAVVVETTGADATPSREVRVLARGWLHGYTAAYGNDFLNQENMIAAKDRTAALLLDTTGEAGEIYEQLTDVDAPLSLPADHPLAKRIDAAEVIAWRTFVGYVRTLAGE